MFCAGQGRWIAGQVLVDAPDEGQSVDSPHGARGVGVVVVVVVVE